MKRLAVLSLVICLVATQGAFAAGVLYGTNSWGYPSSVWTLDQSTGAATKVTDIIGPGSLSYTGADFLQGKFWVSDMDSGNAWDLGWVDLNTGVYTYEYDQASENWQGLAANRAAGVLYSIDLDLGSTMLVSYAPGSGARTDIGGTGVDGRGMAFDNNHGILYATGYDSGTNLYSIDVTTAASTLIGALPFDSYWVGLAYDEIDDVLWAVDGLAAGALYRIEPATGAGTYVGTAGVSNLDGLAWDAGVASVPAPGALILGGIGTAFAGWLRRRRTL